MKTLVGVDKTSFEASDAAATAFKEAVVLAMSGDLTSDDVTKLSVEDLATRRRLQSAASALIASFTVDAQSVYSANQLFAELSSAVTSGAFNTVLFDRATAAGATALAGSTARSISRTSESSEPELSVGGIVGIAIGGAALLVILIGLVYWVRVRAIRSRTGTRNLKSRFKFFLSFLSYPISLRIVSAFIVYVEAKNVEKNEEQP